jgi:RHS repeat-associated protein
MKIIIRYTLLTVLLVAAGFVSHAQLVPNYEVEKSGPVALTELAVSKTVIFTDTETPELSAEVTTGITFNFDGAAYTSVRIHPQGWISLGDGDPGIDGNNVAKISAPVIAPLWDNFHVSQGENEFYEVSYLLVSTPNDSDHIFIVQWKDMSWTGGIREEPGALVTFQLKLYESDGRIEFVYDFSHTFSFDYDPTGGAEPGNSGATIGIGGVSFGSENLRTYNELYMDLSTVSLNNSELNGYQLTFTQGEAAIGEFTASARQVTGTVYPGDIDQGLLRIQVVNPYGYSGELQQLQFRLSGTTNLYDLKSIKLYSSGIYPSIESASLLEEKAVMIGNPVYTFSGMSFTLTEGSNYFWMLADIDSGAIEGNLIDMELISFMVSDDTGKVGNGNPLGARLIMAEADGAQRGLDNPTPIETADYSRNWTDLIVYDDAGLIISQTRTYTDLLGRTVQTQNHTAGKILATQTVFDAFGRPALQSLPALVIGQSNIVYKSKLLSNTAGNAYSYTDFDVYNSNNSLNKLINPNAVGEQAGTIGWYYSNSNSAEPYVASSDFPYSRVQFSNDPGSSIYKSAMAGERLKAGSGHESYAFQMISGGELAYVYGYMRSYVRDIERSSGNIFDNTVGDILLLNKNISMNPDSMVSIVYTNSIGLVVASCLSGQNSGAEPQKVAHQLRYNTAASNKYADAIDIHLPKSKTATLAYEAFFTGDALMSNVDIRIIDLKHHKQLIVNTDYTLATDPSNSNRKKVTFSSAYAGKDLFLRISDSWTTPVCSSNCTALDYVSIQYDLDYSHWNLNYYDARGNLLTSVQPAAVNMAFVPTASSQLYVDNDRELFWGPTFDMTERSIASPANTDRVLKITINPKAYPEGGGGHSSLRGIDQEIEYVDAPRSRYHAEDLSENDQSGGGLFTTWSQNIAYKKFAYKFDLYGDNGTTVKKINILPIEIRFNLIVKKNDSADLLYVIDGFEQNSVTFTVDNYRMEDFTSYQLKVAQASFCPTGIQCTSFIPYDVPGEAGTDNDEKYYVETDLSGTRVYFHDKLRFDIQYEERSFPRYNGLSDTALVNQFSYDGEKRLIRSLSPDEGRTERVYDSEGKLRFMQNSAQRSSGKFSYINYDASDRVTETGEYDPLLPGNPEILTPYFFFETSAVYDPNLSYPGMSSIVGIVEQNGSFDTYRCTQQTYFDYDGGNTDVPVSVGTQYKQRFAEGRLSKSWNAGQATWYSYDEQGRLSWTVMSVGGNVGVKTVDYEYNYLGTLHKKIYQKGSDYEKFEHIYDYDNYQRLASVATLQGLENTPVQQAAYSYYLHGPLKRTELGVQLQGIDYVYTINGWLKSINDPSLQTSRDPGADNALGAHSGFAKDVFGMSLDYHDQDYTRSGTLVQDYFSATGSLHIRNRYDGTIKAQRWNTVLPSSETNAYASYSQLMFGYTYDSRGQLSGAVFGTATIGDRNGSSGPVSEQSFSDLPEYRISNLGYDLNGNLSGLRRTGNNSSNSYLMDDLSYAYNAGKNQLKRVSDLATSGTYAEDIDHQADTVNYEYNSIGQLVLDKQKDIRLEYNVSGLVTKIYTASSNELKIEYSYNESGQRLRKKVYRISGTSTTRENALMYYIHDAAGSLLAIHEGAESQSLSGGVWSTTLTTSIDVTEYPIYGQGRIGMLNMTASNTIYELQDHLGNVRATISRTKVSGQAEVLSYADYYAHGSVLPGRSKVSSPSYRFAYQGQEREIETKWLSFDLRMYDADIARWLSPDPMGQYHSPYLAMGNDPVNMVDPTGGVGISSINTEPTPSIAYVDAFALLDEQMAESFAMTSAGGGNGDRGTSDYAETVKEIRMKKLGYGVNYNPFIGAIGPMREVVVKLVYYKTVTVDRVQSQVLDEKGNIVFEKRVTETHLMIDKVENVKISGEWIGLANTWNGGVGVLAGVVENISHKSKIGSNLKIYWNGWGGNQYVSTVKIANIGKFVGYATLVVGVALDVKGVYNYYNSGAESDNAVHPSKAGLNLGVGIWGLMNPATATGAALYYGIDTFYPGGWDGALKQQQSLILQNRAILGPRFNLYKN